MIALIISTVCGAFFSIFFKIFKTKKINAIQAIIFNYATAVVLGYFLSLGGKILINPLKAKWLPIASFLGIFFIGGFVIMSLSTHRVGVAVTSVASRASMIIPIVFCFYFIPESTPPKWFAIAIIFVALYMVIYPGKEHKKHSKVNIKYNIWLPFLVFISFGLCNSLLKLLQFNVSNSGDALNPYLNQELALITSVIFLSAMFLGIIYYFIGPSNIRGKFQFKNLLGGIALGGCNFFTTYFLMISMKSIQSAVLFPVHNIGIILIDTFAGYLWFKERLNSVQLVGIVVSSFAIILLFF